MQTSFPAEAIDLHNLPRIMKQVVSLERDISMLGCRSRHNYRNGLFGDHAATMVQFTPQDDIRAVAEFIKERVNGDPGPQMAGNIEKSLLCTMWKLPPA